MVVIHRFITTAAGAAVVGWPCAWVRRRTRCLPRDNQTVSDVTAALPNRRYHRYQTPLARSREFRNGYGLAQPGRRFDGSTATPNRGPSLI